RLDVRFAAHVAAHGHRLRAYSLGYLLRALQVHVRDHDALRPFPGEPLREACADAARAARDHHHLVPGFHATSVVRAEYPRRVHTAPATHATCPCCSAQLPRRSWPCRG